MKVVLMAHTPAPDWLCTTAGRTCYSPLAMHDIEQDEEGCEAWLADKVRRGHSSILEHASFTFSVSGVSRSLTHQLVRHRLASYSQQSQRYVKTRGAKFVVPPTIHATYEHSMAAYTAWDEYMDVLDHITRTYDRLVEMGIPAEDARYVLPNATHTNIVVTMNARELRHFFALRLCSKAQWEIRELASKMLVLAKEVAPGLFHRAGPDCPNCVQACSNQFDG